MSFAVFSCRNCGAGVESPPDNYLVICSYCGDTYPSKELSDLSIAIIPSPSKKEVIKSVHARMAADPQMKGVKINITELEGVYVPIFITRTKLSGDWKGYKKEKQGKSTVKKHFNGELAYDGDFPVLARKNAYEFGMTSIGQILFKQKPVSISEIDWEEVGLSVLAVDIDEEFVDIQIKDDLVNTVGENISSSYNLTAFTAFSASVELVNRGIVLFPFWNVMYKYKGGSYRVAVGGADPEVIAAMEPVFLANRLWNLTLGFAAIVGSGLVILIGIPILLATEDDAFQVLVAIVLAIGFCATMAWKTAPKLIASIRVEMKGKDMELKS